MGMLTEAEVTLWKLYHPNMDDNSVMVHHCSFQCSVQTAVPLWSLLPSPWQLSDACMSLCMVVCQEVV